MTANVRNLLHITVTSMVLWWYIVTSTAGIYRLFRHSNSLNSCRTTETEYQQSTFLSDHWNRVPTVYIPVGPLKPSSNSLHTCRTTETEFQQSTSLSDHWNRVPTVYIPVGPLKPSSNSLHPCRTTETELLWRLFLRVGKERVTDNVQRFIQIWLLPTKPITFYVTYVDHIPNLCVS
jgi:hypothetical protein